jgi:hypothetical protein
MPEMKLYHLILDRLFSSYSFRQHFDARVNDMLRSRPAPHQAFPGLLPNPYANKPQGDLTGLPERCRGLFITARFRSGSTLLWHLYANLPGVTAYYEPLHEVRWFMLDEPGSIDPTHYGVSDYRLGYEGMKDLDACFDVEWGYKRLWMDGASFDWKLKSYVAALVTRAKGFPVLQFNRVDFRLQWLRANFLECPILHLIRDPRDQWRSALFDRALDPRLSIAEFRAHDHFALLPWVTDLTRIFPCLDLPPQVPAYRLHYLIWRLSQISGERYADMTITYEELAADPIATLRNVTRVLGLTELADRDYTKLAGLAVSRPPAREDELGPWYEEQEHECESALQILLQPGGARRDLERAKSRRA